MQLALLPVTAETLSHAALWVSAFVLVNAQGLHPDLATQWVRSCLTTWPVAFPTVFVVAPLVRRIVNRVTA